MHEHKIVLTSPKVQLALKLIDDYTNEMVYEDIRVFIPGQLNPPILNRSGYFVFTKINGQAESLVIQSKFFYNEILEIDTSDYKSGEICHYLTPNTIYPFPSDATLIRGVVKEKAASIKVKVDSEEMALGRLTKEFRAKSKVLELVKIQGKTRNNMLYSIMNVVNKTSEFCIIKDEIVQRGTYDLIKRPSNTYPKGSLLLLAKKVMVDERNQFTIYFRKLSSLECKITLCLEDKNIELNIKEGETLNIGLIN